MNFGDINKLDNMNIAEFLSDNEKSQLSDIFNQAGMKDWVLDMSDNSVKLQIKLINKSNNSDPIYQKEGDSGFDFSAFIDDEITLQPMQRMLIPTGLYFQIPNGFELQIRPRSGLAFKNGITVLNSPGTIDAGYRGEIKVLLINFGSEPFTIKSGDRIAQGVIAPVQIRNTTVFTRVNSLDSSDRGAGGFGSTGV
jgi:dUTP pyrophosphatase